MHNLNHRCDVTVTEFSNKPNDPSRYNEALKKLCTIDSSEELSYLLRHLVGFGESSPFNINIFRSGISASWEDESNILGCSWSIQCKPEVSNLLFERLAIYFLLRGFEKFECNGISANVRRNFVKLSVWSRSIPLVADGCDVLDELRESIGLDSSVEFSYKNHKDLLEKVASLEKASNE